MVDQQPKLNVVDHTKKWAAQTVTFALSVRGANTGMEMPPAEQMQMAKRVVDELWSRTGKELKSGSLPAAVLTKFAHKVIDWSSDYVAGTLSETEQDIKFLRNWGRQTIAAAVTVRSHDIGKPIADEDTKRATAAVSEIQKTGIDLWEDSLKEAKSKPDQVKLFMRKIINWSVRHLKD